MACKYTKNFLVTTICLIFFSHFHIWHIFRLHFTATNRHIMNNRIIIYSPSQHLATLVTSIIEDDGLQIIHCTSLEQLLSLCSTGPPSLIIFLAIAPFLDGSEIISNIRATSRQRISIYVISWQQSENVVLSLLEGGADQYMTFPICMTRLKLKTIEHFEQQRHKLS